MAKKKRLKKIGSRKEVERPVRYREYEYLFLIVCEDEKTEPTYFDLFKSQLPENIVYLSTVGTGRDPKGVVEQAILERDKLKASSKREVDYVWVVFDKDDADKNAATINRFNDAFKIAESNEFYIAYSNEAFELWLLLHLKSVENVSLPREEIYKQLQLHISKNPKYSGFVYEHGKPSILEAISKIGSQKRAIKRAAALYEAQQGIAPINANPSTTVFILVNELLNLIKIFSKTIK